MNYAPHYARALYELIRTSPERSKEYLQNLGQVLERRYHQKLFLRIMVEYEKVLLQEGRLAEQKRITPEQQRTRTLLELYRTLTH